MFFDGLNVNNYTELRSALGVVGVENGSISFSRFTADKENVNRTVNEIVLDLFVRDPKVYNCIAHYVNHMTASVSFLVTIRRVIL